MSCRESGPATISHQPPANHHLIPIPGRSDNGDSPNVITCIIHGFPLPPSPPCNDPMYAPCSHAPRVQSDAFHLTDRQNARLPTPFVSPVAAQNVKRKTHSLRPPPIHYSRPLLHRPCPPQRGIRTRSKEAHQELSKGLKNCIVQRLTSPSARHALNPCPPAQPPQPSSAPL